MLSPVPKRQLLSFSLNPKESLDQEGIDEHNIGDVQEAMCWCGDDQKYHNLRAESRHFKSGIHFVHVQRVYQLD